MNKELKEYENHLGSLEQIINDAIISVNSNGRIIFWNNLAREMFGYSGDYVIGKPIEIIIPKRFLGDHEKKLRSLASSEESQVTTNTMELKGLRNDGSEIPIELSLGLWRMKEEVYFTGILRNISKRKEIEAALKEYSMELKNSNKLKDLFIDIITHDLLNPAGAALSMARMVAKDEEDENRAQILKVILRSNERIVKMIENASVLVKLESGERKEQKENDLGLMLRSTVSELDHLADIKGMGIKVDAPGKYPARVSTLFYDVLSNLLSNAIKYGPVNSRIIAGIKEEETTLKISFSDNGEGVPDEDKSAIFRRFKRLRKGPVKGSGLGLAIVQRVIDSHNGSVWVEDNPDGGSIFSVRVPKI